GPPACATGARLADAKVPVTERAWSMTTVHGPLPTHAPDQPRKTDPVAARAAIETVAPLSMGKEQDEGAFGAAAHSRPGPADTVPAPPATEAAVRVSCVKPRNVTVSARSASS